MARQDFVIGTTISHYRILEAIGAGGMGVVYKAEDLKLKRFVALKFLARELADDAKSLARFQREAQAASALNHPNICTIYEIDEADGLHFIAMELIEGRTLKDMIAGKPLAVNQILDLTIQIADALDAASSRGIIHRDLKPANIIVTNQGRPKVLDFGLAKLMEPQAQLEAMSIETLSGEPRLRDLATDPGMVVGTLCYMSPEQARCEELDARTDIFSVGAILYEMATGRRAFAGRSLAMLYDAILNRPVEPVTELNSAIPFKLEEIIYKAIEKDRDLRYQSAAELRTDLKRMIRDSPSGIAPSSQYRTSQISERSGQYSMQGSGILAGLPSATRPPAWSDSASRRPWLVAGLLAGLVLAAAAAVLIYRYVKLPSVAPVQRNLVRLTYDAGLQSEPAWSPDGRFVAYSSNRGEANNFDIWVQQTDGSNSVRVTNNPAHEWQPSWSPDGNRLVFRSERGQGGLFVVPALGGAERQITTFGYRPRWSPHGSRVLFYSSVLRQVTEPPKIWVVSAEGGEPKEILQGFAARSVAWYPDGERVSLWGQRLPDDHPGFWTVRLQDGSVAKSEMDPEVAQRFQQAGLTVMDFAWDPTGKALFFEGVSHGLQNLWKVGVDPDTMRWIAGPERLTTGPGMDSDFALSADGARIAFTIRREETRAWLLPFDEKAGRVLGDGQVISPAGMEVWASDLSPDEKKVAFLAQHADRQELWSKSLTDGKETLLAGPDGFERGSVQWSRDSQQLAYRRVSTDPVKSKEGFQVVAWTPEGERPLTSPGWGAFSDWSPDGQSILGSHEFTSAGANPANSAGSKPVGRESILLTPLAGAPHAETQARFLASHPDYNLWQPRFSPDGKWICFAAVKATAAGVSMLHVMPAGGGEWKSVTDGVYWDDKPRWSTDGRTLYFLSNRSGFLNVWGIRFNTATGTATGPPFRVTGFERPDRMISTRVGPMNISLAASRMIVPIMEVAGNIWVLDNVNR